MARTKRKKSSIANARASPKGEYGPITGGQIIRVLTKQQTTDSSAKKQKKKKKKKKKEVPHKAVGPNKYKWTRNKTPHGVKLAHDAHHHVGRNKNKLKVVPQEPPKPFMLRLPNNKKVPLQHETPWYSHLTAAAATANSTLSQQEQQSHVLFPEFANEQMMQQLDAEISAFGVYVQLTDLEKQARQHMIDYIQDSASELFGATAASSSSETRIELKAFGSHATPSVCCFASDVDLALWGVVPPAAPTTRLFFEAKNSRSRERGNTTKEAASSPNKKRESKIQKWRDALASTDQQQKNKSAEELNNNETKKMSKQRQRPDSTNEYDPLSYMWLQEKSAPTIMPPPAMDWGKNHNEGESASDFNNTEKAQDAKTCKQHNVTDPEQKEEPNFDLLRKEKSDTTMFSSKNTDSAIDCNTEKAQNEGNAKTADTDKDLLLSTKQVVSSGPWNNAEAADNHPKQAKDTTVTPTEFLFVLDRQGAKEFGHGDDDAATTSKADNDMPQVSSSATAQSERNGDTMEDDAKTAKAPIQSNETVTNKHAVDREGDAALEHDTATKPAAQLVCKRSLNDQTAEPEGAAAMQGSAAKLLVQATKRDAQSACNDQTATTKTAALVHGSGAAELLTKEKSLDTQGNEQPDPRENTTSTQGKADSSAALFTIDREGTTKDDRDCTQEAVATDEKVSGHQQGSSMNDPLVVADSPRKESGTMAEPIVLDGDDDELMEPQRGQVVELCSDTDEDDADKMQNYRKRSHSDALPPSDNEVEDAHWRALVEEKSRTVSLSSTDGSDYDDDNHYHDMQVSMVSHGKPRQAIVGPTGPVRELVVRALQKLGRRLRKCHLTHAVEVRRFARVPIISMATTLGFESDVAIGGHNGTDTSQYASNLATKYKSFACVVLLLKILLVQQGLDKPFTGGLGSYKLYVLVAHHLEQHLALGGSDRPSEVLLAFFFRYGNSSGRSTTRLSQKVMLRSNGGSADLQPVFHIDACSRLFQMCWDKITSYSYSQGTSYLARVIHSNNLRHEREKCIQKAVAWKRRSSQTSNPAARIRSGKVGNGKQKVGHVFDKGGSVASKKRQSRPDDEVSTDEEANRLMAGYGVARGPHGGLIPKNRPDVVAAAAAGPESALLGRARKRRKSKKKQSRDPSLEGIWSTL